MFFENMFAEQSSTVTIACVVLLVILGILYLLRRFGILASPYKKAGNRGEKIAKSVVDQALYDSDLHLCNVKIQYQDKETELDNLIINNRGVFIIEVKNYSGKLYGTEEDEEWTKIKTTDAGNDYEKTVRNPLKQVSRQEYILKHYLKEKGFDIWVEGYVYLVEKNAPFKSKRILETVKDIENAVHYGVNNKIYPDQMKKLKAVF